MACIRRANILICTCISTLIFILIYRFYTNDLGRERLTLKDLPHVTEPEVVGNVVDVMFTFTRVKKNALFVSKFKTCLSSLAEHSTIHLNFHLITDEASQVIAASIIASVLKQRERTFKYKVNFYLIKDVVKDVNSTVNTLRQHFSSKPGAYYSDALFFLSPILHNIQIFSHLRRIIIFDVDVKFADDIKNLYEYFDHFKNETIMGMAYEQQPVYRHLLAQFRKSHPGTMIGDPPESGFPGFNSGVVLMDLAKMRKSLAYDSFLDSKEIGRVVKKFDFKGHLGDQDFYSLLSFEYPQFFYVIPCSWNRQLCEWWRKNGYANEFQSYHACHEKIKLFHGNCNTMIVD